MAKMPEGITLTQVGATPDHIVYTVGFSDRWMERVYSEAGEMRRKLNPVKSTSRRFQAGTRRTKRAARRG
jgi:hypothetical protein